MILIVNLIISNKHKSVYIKQRLTNTIKQSTISSQCIHVTQYRTTSCASSQRASIDQSSTKVAFLDFLISEGTYSPIDFIKFIIEFTDRGIQWKIKSTRISSQWSSNYDSERGGGGRKEREKREGE